MIDPSDLYGFVFTSASILLIIEAVFAVMGEMKSKSSTKLSQATVWIRSLLMIVLAIVILVFLRSSQTTAQPVM
jgi:hypothetical protein